MLKWLFKRFKKQKTKRSRKSARVRARNKAFITEYKSHCSCLDCGEDHSACLEFHHLDKSKKIGTISSGVRKGWSIPKIKREIAKCIILCCNCHRKKHFAEVV